MTALTGTACAQGPVPAPASAVGGPIWINAGELSGDIHGALLLKALQKLVPSLSFTGMGGPHLREAGLDALFRVEDLSVMGLTEVLGHIPKILRIIKGIAREMQRVRPRALVVIDAPDFNFRVIKAAAKLGIPVYYYISPKVWAWRQGRVQFIKKHVRKVISILPFEVEFYRQFGMDIDYVGNPLIDMLDIPGLEEISPDPALIGFLPGSRKKEISSLMPEFARAASILKEKLPGLKFACGRAPNVSPDYLMSFWNSDIELEMAEPENRYAFMRRAELLVAASGTVTLESAILGTPTIAAYKVSALSYFIGKRLVRIPYMSLANLILNREVLPEYLQSDSDGPSLAKRALDWLLPEGRPALAETRRSLAALRQLLGPPGAPERAARVILDDLS